jgi:hypothetical protein
MQLVITWIEEKLFVRATLFFKLKFRESIVSTIFSMKKRVVPCVGKLESYFTYMMCKMYRY